MIIIIIFFIKWFISIFFFFQCRKRKWKNSDQMNIYQKKNHFKSFQIILLTIILIDKEKD